MGKLIIFIFIPVLISFSACTEDNPVINQGNFTGIVTDGAGFPDAGNIVSVNSKPPYVVTTLDGKFAFDNIVLPCNVNFNSVLYKNILHSSIKLNVPYNGFSFHSSNYTKIKLTIPIFTDSNEYVMIGLLSNDPVSFNTHTFFVNEFSSYQDCYLPANYYSASVKFVYLSYRMSNSGRIISYEQFGIKDMSISVGGENSVTFLQEDLSYNPPESNIIIDVNTPQNIRYSFTSIYLNFSNYNISTIQLMNFDAQSSSIIHFKAPLNLPVPFELIAKNETYKQLFFKKDSANIEDSEMLLKLNPGESGNINYPERPELIYPGNFAENINENTVFTFGDNNSAHVYQFEIMYYGSTYAGTTVITESNSVSMQELLDNGFRFNNYGAYSWRVKQYSGFSSVDEFVSYKYNENENFQNIIASEIRSFTTGNINSDEKEKVDR